MSKIYHDFDAWEHLENEEETFVPIKPKVKKVKKMKKDKELNNKKNRK
jgi:hypothetical protein